MCVIIFMYICIPGFWNTGGDIWGKKVKNCMPIAEFLLHFWGKRVAGGMAGQANFYGNERGYHQSVPFSNGNPVYCYFVNTIISLSEFLRQTLTGTLHMLRTSPVLTDSH